ncbi:MAG: hypothetical protein IJF09_00450 [Ruminiclostridium sp.]|nr:hypothetical protein [Ruminiclostridium sp.]MBQ8932119.1 hypothetical protein [Ruminiclostridium sp.]
MKKADATNLLQLMDKLTELMTEYNKRTDRMVTFDLEIIQQVLLSRNEIMDSMRQVKSTIMEVVNAQAPAEREILRNILNNKPVEAELSYELRQLQGKMRRLQEIKQEIDQKDKKVTAVVTQSYEDVKAELEALKVDKKKIDYYSSVKLGGKGRTFSTNS